MVCLRPRICTLTALALIAGCAGSRTVPMAAGDQVPSNGTLSRTPVLRSADRVVPNSGAKGKLVFRFSIPTLGGGANGESYVSSASKGLGIALTGPTDVAEAFAVGSGAQGCKVAKSGKVNCSVSIAGLKGGSYTALVNLYDQTPNPFPTGNVLSTVPNAQFTIVGGQTTNFAPTLAGIPSSIAVTNLPTSCATFGPTPFTVTVSDADGNTIVGAYAAAIALTDSDQSGNTALATSGPDNPAADQLLSSLDTATIAWNGTGVGSVTISAQAGSVSGSGTFGAGLVPSSQSFSFAPFNQSFVVPLCATSVYVTAQGASGAAPSFDFDSVGGTAAGTIPTTPGETLVVLTGGAGSDWSPDSSSDGGYNLGGNGGGPDFVYGGGGGASDVRQGGSALTNRVVVGGGGGGFGTRPDNNTWGTGGGVSGDPGFSNTGECNSLPITGGGGGTQTTGGIGGINNGPTNGRFGFGGTGASEGSACAGGGGGGGWYGGGGGFGAGGGGGSGYVEPTATNITLTTGTAPAGNGSVTICWGYANGQCSGSALKKFSQPKRVPKPTRH